MEDCLKVNVLFRFSKKSGVIDTTMVGLGTAQMKLWSLNNTTSSKSCVIIERETGLIKFLVIGKKEGFPHIEPDEKLKNLTCDKMGIPIEMVQDIKDSRFDDIEEV